MLIRCDKCATVYELDEALLPPQGAPVQCSKCQYVFKAYRKPAPVAAPAPTAEQPPAPPAPAPSPPSVDPAPRAADVASERAVDPPAPAARPDAASAGASHPPAPPGPADGAAAEPQRTADGRPIRKVPFPSAQSAEVAPGAPRPAIIRAPPGRARPAGPERRSAPTWFIAVAVIAAVALAVLGWRLFARRSPSLAHRPGAQSVLVSPVLLWAPPLRPGADGAVAPPRR